MRGANTYQPEPYNATFRPDPRDPWERRMLCKHGLPLSFARAYADLRNGKPD